MENKEIIETGYRKEIVGKGNDILTESVNL